MKKINISIAAMLLVSFVLLGIGYAAIPHLVNYQGKLTDKDGKPLEGAFDITFRIYDAETAGNLLWQETQAGVVIQKGLFNAFLGAVTNLNLAFDKPYFLEIKVGSEVLAPRQRITSAGYAYMAENVKSIPKGVIVLWSGKISDIPSGWALCNGTNGTPDLRDRFIVGANQDQDEIAKTNITGILTQIGGNTSITVENLPPHKHQNTAIVRGRNNAGNNATIADGNGDPTYGTLSPTANTGSGTPYTQPYYALAYIMKID